KRGDALRSVNEKRAYVRDHRPPGVSVAQGCRLMGISRCGFSALPADGRVNGKIVGEMQAIADEFEAYGYRGMTAELRHRGLVGNATRARRLMGASARTP